MKNLLTLSFVGMCVVLSGCIVDVTEQSTERWAYASGKNITSTFFDASLYRDAFSVQGSAADTLIADGTFSLWAPGSSAASSIAQDVNLFWATDQLHQAIDTLEGRIFANSNGPQKELLSIDRMGVTVPARTGLNVITTSNDVDVKGMSGNTNVAGNTSNITFNVPGRITLQTVSGKITGSTGLGGSAQSGSGDINVTVTSPKFITVFANDTTGNVTVYLPKGVGVNFQLYTHGGNINLKYDGLLMASPSAIITSANGGGSIVYVATETGNVSVFDSN